MGSVKVVVDTNVLISALLFGGKPEELISFWLRGKINPLASKEIMDEYLRVLTYPKFKLSEEEINYLLYSEILPYFDVIDVPPRSRIINTDPEVDKFISCASAGRARYIISGDQHLLSIRSFQKIKILTPADFLAKVLGMR